MAPSSSFDSEAHPIVRWDKDMSYLIYRFYNSNFPRWPLIVLELSGHGVPWLIVPVVIFLFKPELSPAAASLLLNFLAITILDLVVIGVTKPMFRRQRPVYNSGIAAVTIHAVDQYSFPSGHATRAALVTSFLCYARQAAPDALHPFIASQSFAIAVFLWASLVCISRVALGRHHILDVLLGSFIGASYILLWTPFWINDETADRFRNFLHGLIAHSDKDISET